MQTVDTIIQIAPAKRLSSVEEYYFSQKLKEVAAMNAAGANVINLGVGSPDLPPSEEVIDTFCDAIRAPGAHGYQPYTGIPELRNAFAAWYKRWYGVTLDPDREIQPLIGSKEGIMHISLAFLNPGDKVLIPNPGYPTYAAVSKLVGAEIVYYDLKAENDWMPDFDTLNALDLSGVKLMWVNYPNMPTGKNASRELFRKLVAFGRKHGIVICNDNPYSFILNDEPLSLLSVEGAKDICLELNSMSKSHNMPGWRIAMLAGNPQFISWVLKVKSNVDSGQFKPMQFAAAEALNAPRAWYDTMNNTYRERRELAGEIMNALGCRYDPKQVGLFLWGKIEDPSVTSEELADTLLHRAQVFVTPGFIFGSQGDRYMRISLCCNKETLQKALERVSSLR